LRAYLWAAPASLAALPAAAAALATGGRAGWRGGILEVSGGVLRPLLARAIPCFPIAAVTLGHVVLGGDARALEENRAHERVHVGQYERWGPLFPVLYAAASLAALARGGHAYGNNAFEREAFRKASADLAV